MTGAGEASRARAVRALGSHSHTDSHAAMVAALLYIGDQLAHIAELLPDAVGRLDQGTAALADITHAVKQLIPEEDR